ncbi:MAG: hypothetical protein LQ350_003556 [Teloschistes chrysophthalmus]|nr:MAG: hypothetical protein LQ350_003556 [Niorma chrysophthalma]
MNAAQANSHPHSGVHVQKVQQPVFLGLIWTGLAVAIICCALRILVRIRAFKKLLVDDYFVLLALSFVLANAITWQVYAQHMYYVIAVSAGVEAPDENFPQVAGRYFKSTAAVIILFYSALWAIKMSFLLFFRRLGNNVRGQKMIWWPVFVITVATYFACIGTIQYQCLVSSFEYLATNCKTPSATSFQQITLKLNCAWDVITDCLIMLIPFSMLKGVQMRWQRKLALSGIFSLVIITMIFAIVRTALVGSSNTKQPDSSWLYMWSAIEASVAIIVACLATFRNLFSRESSRHKAIKPEAPASSNLFLRGNGRRKKIRDILDSLVSIPEHTDSGYEEQNDYTSDARSIIDHRDHNAHHLDDMARAV